MKNIKLFLFAVLICLLFASTSLAQTDPVKTTTVFVDLKYRSSIANPNENFGRLYVDNSGIPRYRLNDGTDTPLLTGTSAVNSFNGRTGVVVPVSGDYTTTLVTEGTNQYFTNARARAALSGITGVTYNSTTGEIAIGQAVATTDTPTFGGLTITGLSGVVKASAGVLSASSITNSDVSNSAAIAYSKLNLTGAILNADLAGSIAASKLVGTDIATVGTVTTGTWSATAIAINKGGTGQTTQTAAFNALSPLTTSGDIIYFNGTNNVRLAKGNDGQVLTLASGLPSWVDAGGGGGGISGSGSTDRIPVFTSGSAIGNSVLYQNTSTSRIGIGASPSFKIHIQSFTGEDGVVVQDNGGTGDASSFALFHGSSANAVVISSQGSTINTAPYSGNNFLSTIGRKFRFIHGDSGNVYLDLLTSDNVNFVNAKIGIQNASPTFSIDMIGRTGEDGLFITSPGGNSDAAEIVAKHSSGNLVVLASAGSSFVGPVYQGSNYLYNTGRKFRMIDATGSEHIWADYQTNGNITLDPSNAGYLLHFGGTSSSFPALKHSSTELQARLADDSAYAPFRASIITASTINAKLTTSALFDAGNSGTAITLDFPTNGSNQQVTLNNNTTITVTSLTDGAAATVKIVQGSAFTVAWTTVTWDSATTPTFTSNTSLVQLWKLGSTIYGRVVFQS